MTIFYSTTRVASFTVQRNVPNPHPAPVPQRSSWNSTNEEQSTVEVSFTSNKPHWNEVSKISNHTDISMVSQKKSWAELNRLESPNKINFEHLKRKLNYSSQNTNITIISTKQIKPLAITELNEFTFSPLKNKKGWNESNKTSNNSLFFERNTVKTKREFLMEKNNFSLERHSSLRNEKMKPSKEIQEEFKECRQDSFEKYGHRSLCKNKGCHCECHSNA